MSKKNISRSALEGGRANSSRNERRESIEKERARVKSWLRKTTVDPEQADVIPARIRPVSKEFADKLSPGYRWLASRAGRPWDDVYSELKRTFDTRNLSSWHIVHQHMLAAVHGCGAPNDGIGMYSSYLNRFRRFYIDADGILRDRGKDHYRARARERGRAKGPSKEEVFAVAQGRVVIDYGVSQFWGDPSGTTWSPCERPSHCTLPHKLIEFYSESEKHRSFKDSTHYRVYLHQHLMTCGWRQGRRFTLEETAWWRTISPKVREAVTRKPGATVLIA